MMRKMHQQLLPPLQILVSLCLLFNLTGTALAEDLAFSVYGGRLTNDPWEKSIAPGVDFADAGLVVVSGSWTFARVLGDKLSFEVEANLAKQFGDQDHWEINLPIVAFRWHRFPWDDTVATSFAWGIGSSYATDEPPVERENNDESKKWLIYWFGEFTFGPPDSPWELLTRLHHRSDGFGALNGGGSNALCLGFRYRF